MNENEFSIYKYGKDITWSIPILFQYEPVYAAIYKLFAQFEIFLPQVNAFGSPTLAWTGGRAPAVTGEFDSKTLLKIYNYLSSVNAVPALTFTYTGITKEDLEDKYANYFLDIALEAKAHFIIYSDLLKNHIKEKDPDAYVVASVIKPSIMFQGPDKMKDWSIEKEAELYNNLLKEYDLVVVRPEFSKGPLLQDPSIIDDISRIEVLINQPCIQNCPRMPQHYRHLENMRLGKEHGKGNFQCIKSTLPKGPALYKNTLAHNHETIQKLVDSGVKHLKIQGRGVENLAQSLALMMYTQMFNTNGYGYTMMEQLMHGHVENEIDAFKNLLESSIE